VGPYTPLKRAGITEAPSAPQSSGSITLHKNGAEHPSVATALNNLGTLRHQLRDLNDAERLLTRALSIREKKLGKNHPDVAETMSNLAMVKKEKREYKKQKNRTLGLAQSVKPHMVARIIPRLPL